MVKRRKFKSFDYRPYITINEIDCKSVDFVIIAYKEGNDIELAEKKLIDVGYEYDRIIPYEYFRETLCIDPVKQFQRIPYKNWDGLLFGMSHSQTAIQTQYLKKKFYKFSCPSMDMFCQYKIIDSLCKNNREIMENIREVVFEFPYYYFNYDLSLFKEFVCNRLYYFYAIGDFHHYGENSIKEKMIISQFNSYVRIFGIENRDINYTYNFEPKSENVINTIRHRIGRVYRHAKLLMFNDSVWKKEYDKTIAENEEYWDKIVNMLMNINNGLKIKISMSTKTFFRNLSNCLQPNTEKYSSYL